MEPGQYRGAGSMPSVGIAVVVVAGGIGPIVADSKLGPLLCPGCWLPRQQRQDSELLHLQILTVSCPAPGYEQIPLYQPYRPVRSAAACSFHPPSQTSGSCDVSSFSLFCLVSCACYHCLQNWDGLCRDLFLQSPSPENLGNLWNVTWTGDVFENCVEMI